MYTEYSQNTIPQKLIKRQHLFIFLTLEEIKIKKQKTADGHNNLVIFKTT